MTTEIQNDASADNPTAAGATQASSDEYPILFLPRPSTIFGWLLLCVSALVLAGISAAYLELALGYDSTSGFARIFDLDGEGNIPTWFSAILLFWNAILLGLIAKATAPSPGSWRRHWGLLALIFVAFSLDEISSIHERATLPIQNALGQGGISHLDMGGMFHFTWVLPAVVLLGAFALIYGRFVLALQPRTCRLFISAGTIYVSGALGLELVGGYFASTGGNTTFEYAVAAIVEETFEMIGLAIFIYALTDYIRGNFNRLVLSFKA